MPKLWTDTIEAHRRAVYEATLDTAAALVTKHGLLAVTMSRLAEETGIGRATLYKYFPDVEAVVTAWHERQITRHLRHLANVRDRADDIEQKIKAVLEAYALIAFELSGTHHGGELAAFLHRGGHVLAKGRRQLNRLFSDLLADGAKRGSTRNDITPKELACYCIHALGAAGDLPSKASVHRLVSITLTALRRA